MQNEELIDTALTDTAEAVENTEEAYGAEHYESDTENEEATDAKDEDDGYYESVMADDLAALKAEFAELAGVSNITEIKNPLRYAALRDLGLTPTEAYLAARGKEIKRDNRAHLCATVPGAVSAPLGTIPKGELERAREIFYGMSDSEIQALYRKVTK